MQSVVCHRTATPSVGFESGGRWHQANRLPLHVAVQLSPYELARAQHHVRGNLPSREELALATLRRALPRILASRT